MNLLFHEARITMIRKSDQNITRKKFTGQSEHRNRNPQQDISKLNPVTF